MYAAAGGASLASRQKRKNQAAQNVKNKALLQQGLKEKLAASRASGLATPTKATSRPFHNLPANYLRTPQPPGGGPAARKLSSGGYTAQSRLLLPINEANPTSVLGADNTQHYNYHLHQQQNQQLHHPTQQQQLLQQQLFAQQTQLQQQQHQQHSTHHRHPTTHPHPHHPHHHHHHHHHHHQHRPHGAAGGHFHHSHSHSQHRAQAAQAKSALLPKSATLPQVVSHAQPISPPTPTTSEAPTLTTTASTTAGVHQLLHPTTSAPPSATNIHDSIVVTPASPSNSTNGVTAATPAPPASAAPADPAATAVTPVQPLERKCSFYRGQRKIMSDGEPDATLDDPRPSSLMATTPSCCPYDVCDDEQCQMPFYSDEYREAYSSAQAAGGGGGAASSTWLLNECDDCDYEHRQLMGGDCSCDLVECAQGRAAWLERGRRCSVQENSASCHRRWVKRNRIHDSSLGGSSDDDDFLGVLRGPSSFANAFLYVGLGTVAIGLVIAFVGTGEKGFKTVELRLIGPSLIGIGLICCVLRILFCICPSHCISSSRRKLKKKNAKVDADHTTSLLRADSKRVSIARGPQQNQKPRDHQRDLSEGMEALRHIATTSLFLQNEKQTTSNATKINVPIIKEPDKSKDAPYEMQKIDEMSIKICSVSDDDDDADDDDDDDVAGAVGPVPGSKPFVYPPQYPLLHQYHQPHNPPAPPDDDDHPDEQSHDLGFPSATTSSSLRTTSSAYSYTASAIRIASPPGELQHRPSKLSRTRAPVHQSKPSTSAAAASKDADILLMETSLMILNHSPSPILPAVHQHHPAHSKPTSPTPILTTSASSPYQFPTPTASSGSPQTPMAKHYQQIKVHQELVQQLAQQHQKPIVKAPISPPSPEVPAWTRTMTPPPRSRQPSTTSHHMTTTTTTTTTRAQHHRPHPLVMPGSSSGGSNEPELVLSPSKLGQ